mmetsp:Transcript_31240/g.71921  ORF Transcript_31240/g.71921 Transcript_31240/m.71921 type:complete len:148 (-) Transcript_31240:235-678(-)
MFRWRLEFVAPGLTASLVCQSTPAPISASHMAHGTQPTPTSHKAHTTMAPGFFSGPKGNPIPQAQFRSFQAQYLQHDLIVKDTQTFHTETRPHIQGKIIMPGVGTCYTGKDKNSRRRGLLLLWSLVWDRSVIPCQHSSPLSKTISSQ